MAKNMKNNLKRKCYCTTRYSYLVILPSKHSCEEPKNKPADDH